MKVNLIYPCSPDSADKHDFSPIAKSLDLLLRPARDLLGLGKTNYTPPLSLLMLGAVTPPDVEVQIIDERLSEIDFHEEVDLVGITVTTRAAPRAYEISTEYRKRGVTVVVGGVHPSVLPEESSRYVDVVVVGEGEEAWPKVLADYKQGSLKRIYRGKRQNNLDELPYPRRELIRHPEDYLTLKVLAASRGCPNSCTFCAAGFAIGKQYRTRKVESVVAELSEVSGSYVAFTDDNLGWDIAYAKKLFRAIVPLNIKWIGSVTLPAVEDDELLELIAKSGCVSLCLGFESLSPRVITDIKKQRTNNPARYRELIKRVHDYGIPIIGTFIVGFDGDDKNTFGTLTDFINETCIEEPTVHVLIPYPGTRIYRQFEREGRLLCKDWKYYDTARGYVVYQPKQMTPEELVDGYLTVLQKVFSLRPAIERLVGARTLSSATIGSLFYNLAWRRSAALQKAQLQKTTENVS